MLVSADHLEALDLLPAEWPDCLDPNYKKPYSKRYINNTSSSEADTNSGVESDPEPETETSPEANQGPVRVPRPRADLEDELWTDCGKVKDIPNLADFTATTQAIFHKYGDIFKTLLSKDRKMKCEPVHLELDTNIPIPPPATKCRLVPIHWRDQYTKLLDTLIKEGIIYKQEAPTTFVAPSFMISKPHDLCKGHLVQNYSLGIKSVPPSSSNTNPSTMASVAAFGPSQHLLLLRRPLQFVLADRTRQGVTKDDNLYL